MPSSSAGLPGDDADRDATPRCDEANRDSPDVGVSTWDLVITLIGYTVGVGNVLHFPYLVGKHYGIGFVVMYLITRFGVAMPLFYLELLLGCHTQKSTSYCYYIIHPAWAGLGWGATFILAITQGFYSVLCAYALLYAVGSLSNPQPWTPGAYAAVGDLPVNTTAAEYYWRYVVLQEPERDYPSEAVSIGIPQWRTALAALGVWGLIFALKSKPLSRKNFAVTLMTLAPIAALTLLCIRCLFLEGAGKGIRAFFGINVEDSFERSFTGSAFIDAVTHNLFSLSPGTGATITLASYARRDAPLLRVALFVTVVDAGVSMVSGMLIYSIIGLLYKDTGMSEEAMTQAVAESGGPSLSFVTAAQGLGDLDDLAGAQCFILFLSMMFLGLTSLLTWVETLITFAMDGLSRLELAATRWFVALIVTVSGYLMCLPFTTPDGYRLNAAVDTYASGYSLMATCVLECVAVAVNRPSLVPPSPVKYYLLTVAPLGALAAMAYSIKNEVTDDTQYSDEILAVALSLLGCYVLLILFGVLRNCTKKPVLAGLPQVDHQQAQAIEFDMLLSAKGEQAARRQTSSSGGGGDAVSFNEMESSVGAAETWSQPMLPHRQESAPSARLMGSTTPPAKIGTPTQHRHSGSLVLGSPEGAGLADGGRGSGAGRPSSVLLGTGRGGGNATPADTTPPHPLRAGGGRGAAQLEGSAALLGSSGLGEGVFGGGGGGGSSAALLGTPASAPAQEGGGGGGGAEQGWFDLPQGYPYQPVKRFPDHLPAALI